jgi:hypothetical protein
MKIRRTIAAAALAVGLAAVTAQPAQAWTYTYGGDIYVVPGLSMKPVYVHNSVNKSLYLCRGCYSEDYWTHWNDVQDFIFYGTGCMGRSQYSPDGRYPYRAGVYYDMSVPNLWLNIIVTCPI